MNIVEIFINSLYLIFSLNSDLWEIISLSLFVSLVALFQKPCISITTDQLEKTVESFSIKKFSSELGTKLINIDHFNDYNSHDFLKYDKNIYNTYIENYVKTPDVKSNDFWSDFIDFFENEN